MNPDYEYRDTISVGIHAEYYVTAVYDDGCEAVSETLEAIGEPDAVNETANLKAVVFPNPVEGDLTVKAESLKLVVIYNVMGQKVTSIAVNHDESIIPTSDFTKGLFTIQLITENGVVYRNIIVK